jgi:hypothetical protein
MTDGTGIDHLTLHQINGVRGDIYGLGEELEIMRLSCARPAAI